MLLNPYSSTHGTSHTGRRLVRHADAFAAAMAVFIMGNVIGSNANALPQAGDVLASATHAASFLNQTGGALGATILSALFLEPGVSCADALQPLINESSG